MVDVIDLLDEVVLLQRDRVEAAHLADHGERRAQLGEVLRGGTGTAVLVVVEHDDAVLVLDRDDGLGEVAARPRLVGEFLRAHGVGVHVIAGEPLDGCDQVGGDTLRHEVGVVVGGRVQRPRATVGAHRHAGHGLHTTGDDQLVEAGADLLRGQVDGLEARGAEAVELEAADGVGQAGHGHRGAGDVGTLVTHRRDDAQDQVGDPVLVEVRETAAQLLDQTNSQIDRLDRVQRTVLLAASARGADGLVNVGLCGHIGVFPSLGCSGGERMSIHALCGVRTSSVRARCAATPRLRRGRGGPRRSGRNPIVLTLYKSRQAAVIANTTAQ